MAVVLLAAGPSPAKAIAVARGTSGILAPFPSRPERMRCRIGRGGLGVVWISSSCRTAVTRGRNGFVVSFVETWKARGRMTHTWRFFEDARARIRREVTFGDFPPQWVM